MDSEWYQRLFVYISSLWPAIGITSDLIIHLNKTLDGDKGLKGPRELTAEAEKALTVIEEKLQETHVDPVEIIMPFTADEIKKSWEDKEP